MKWYHAKIGNIHDQGLVIDEETGENIAVVYDKKNAPLLAAAPELLAGLKAVIENMEAHCSDNVVMREGSALHWHLTNLVREAGEGAE